MMREASKESPAPGSENAAAKTFIPEPLAAEIDFKDFMKIDLRVAKILEAEVIKEADKLIRLKVDIGLETRTIIAGIRQAYNPTDLVGRHIVVVANLEPRKMKFGTSEGMLLASGPGGKEIFILSPDSGASPGERGHSPPGALRLSFPSFREPDSGLPRCCISRGISRECSPPSPTPGCWCFPRASRLRALSKKELALISTESTAQHSSQ